MSLNGVLIGLIITFFSMLFNRKNRIAFLFLLSWGSSLFALDGQEEITHDEPWYGAGISDSNGAGFSSSEYWWRLGALLDGAINDDIYYTFGVAQESQHATWVFPEAEPGKYKVYARIPRVIGSFDATPGTTYVHAFNPTNSAHYTIYDGNIFKATQVKSQRYAVDGSDPTWVSLGEWTFYDTPRVKLTDETNDYTSTFSHVVIYDAIKLVPSEDAAPGAFSLPQPDVSCTGNDGGPRIHLDWLSSNNATSYKIHRNIPWNISNSSWLQVPIGYTSFDNNEGLSSNTTYRFFVRAYSSTSKTTDSNEVTVTTPDCTPATSDLIVINPTVSKSNVQPGESFTIYGTVKNQGDAVSTSTELKFYRSNNSTISTSDLYLSSDSINQLTSGATHYRYDSTEITSEGTYYVGSCVDSIENESVTTNNCSSGVLVTVSQTPVTNYQLSISKSGAGTITSSPGGINCGSDCSESFSKDSIINLSAVPVSGYQFQGWGGACSGTACSIAMNSNKVVTAVFTPIVAETKSLTVTLRDDTDGSYVSSSPSGIHCLNSCTHEFEVDSNITLTAHPSSNQVVAGWAGGCLSQTETTCAVQLGADKHIYVEFKDNEGPELTIIDAPDYVVAGQPYSLRLRALDADGDVGHIDWDTDGDGLSPLRTSAANNQVITMITRYPKEKEGTKITWSATAYDDKGKGGTLKNGDVSVLCGEGDIAVFIRDVTFGDTKSYTPYVALNSEFTKQWEVKNCGTTTWTTDYKLQFVSGNRLGASRSINLVNSVGPGETKILTVPMKAPSTYGTFQGYWQLANGQGVRFPTSKLNQIWVKVHTGSPTRASVNRTNIKKNGENAEGCEAGNPINNATGAQMREHQLLKVTGIIPVTFSINYNSLVVEEGSLGQGWTHNYAFNAKLREAKESDQSSGANDLLLEWSGNKINDYEQNSDDTNTFKSPQVARQFDNLKKSEDGSYTLETGNRKNYVFDPIGEDGITTPGYLSEISNAKNHKLEMSYNPQGLLSKVEEPISGVWLAYEYNEQGLLIRVTDSLGREVRLAYDQNRKLIEIVNAEGIHHFYTYNAEGQTVTHTDSTGVNYFTNTHDSVGHVIYQDDAINTNRRYHWLFDDSDADKIVTTVTDREGNSEQFEFNSVYQLLKQTDKNGHTIANTYNEKGLLTEVTDQKGRKITMTYDDDGNLLTVSDPDGNTTTMTYDESKNLLSRINALNEKTENTYDENNNLITQKAPDGSITRYAYNEHNQISEITTPKGNKTTFTYEEGRVKTKTDAEGNTTSYAYDAAGRLIETTDPDGFKTTFTLDNLDRVVAVEDAEGNITRTTYDSRGNVLTETDPEGNISRREYDGNGNLSKEINALNQITEYEYDGEGRVISITNPRGFITKFEYDRKGQLVKVTDGLNHSRHMEYDETGKLKKQIDAKGQNEAQFTYDARDNLVSTVDALNRVSQSEYDAVNRVISDIDPLNRKTEYQYDLLGRLVTVVDALNGRSTQEFDPDGNRIAFTDPNQNTTQQHYDKNARLVKETTASGSSTEHEYNGRGLISKTINGRGNERVYTYDGTGRVKTVTDPDGTITYSYDKNGNVLTVVENGKTITRTYDELNRVKTYTNADGKTIRYDYDPVGNLEKLTYPDGKIVSYDYDANDRLTKVTDWKNRSVTYEYDQNGRLIKTTRPNGSMLTRSYDIAGQLLQQKDITKTGSVIAQYDFTYDAAGNITEERVIPAYDPKRSIDLVMQYAEGNLLNSVDQNSTGIKTPVFDADDNMIVLLLANKTLNLEYDSRNRMFNGGGMQSFYDAENHRVATTKDGLTTSYTINPEADLSQILEARTNSNNILYLYGMGLLMQEEDNKALYYHYDLRGSTVALTNEQGEVVDRFQYLPYGGLVAHIQGNTNTPFLYNGRDGVMDDGNSLYHMRARFFNLEIRRFINRDTLIGDIDNHQSLNRFTYTVGQPISLIDPSGNVPVETVWDAGNVIYDVGRLGKNLCEMVYEGGKYVVGSGYGYFTNDYSLQQSGENGFRQDAGEFGDALIDTGADGLALVIPYVPAGATKLRYADNAYDFFSGTKYTSKVRQQMDKGDFHSFPEEVRNFQNNGTVRSFIGGDGRTYERLDIQGAYKGKSGTFEFIKDSNGNINHRFFRPD